MRKIKDHIESFKGRHRFLSNFVGGVEQKYQASKTSNWEDKVKILLSTPTMAKKLGRRVKLRKDWNDLRLEIMIKLVVFKFEKEPFKTLLINTGTAYIVEGNCWHDNFWGACWCSKCKDKVKLNHLGKMLMIIRNNHKRQ